MKAVNDKIDQFTKWVDARPQWQKTAIAVVCIAIGCILLFGCPPLGIAGALTSAFAAHTGVFSMLMAGTVSGGGLLSTAMTASLGFSVLYHGAFWLASVGKKMEDKVPKLKSAIQTFASAMKIMLAIATPILLLAGGIPTIVGACTSIGFAGGPGTILAVVCTAGGIGFLLHPGGTRGKVKSNWADIRNRWAGSAVSEVAKARRQGTLNRVKQLQDKERLAGLNQKEKKELDSLLKRHDVQEEKKKEAARLAKERKLDAAILGHVD